MDQVTRLLKAQKLRNQIQASRVAGQIATRDLVKAEELSQDELTAILDVYPDYAVEVSYKINDLIVYNNKLYKVVQAHTSQEDWIPSEVPSLYTPAAPAGVILEWVQPTGAQDAYAISAVVTHNGFTWKSLIDANVWEPTTANSTLWVKVI